MTILKYLQKLYDKLLPPIRFNKRWFKKELEPTEEDLDRWATEYLAKLENERRAKRAKYKN